MSQSEALREKILKQLSTVIDPETGVDVVRMRLIEDLSVDDSGCVSYKFRPSSPLCPIVIPLALMIQKAVAEVPGVTKQDPEIVGYFQAEEITAMLKKEFGDSPIYRNQPGNSDDAR
jgi:metal-sulfur cluster biosynthetic enzyme